MSRLDLKMSAALAVLRFLHGNRAKPQRLGLSFPLPRHQEDGRLLATSFILLSFATTAMFTAVTLYGCVFSVGSQCLSMCGRPVVLDMASSKQVADWVPRCADKDQVRASKTCAGDWLDSVRVSESD